MIIDLLRQHGLTPAKIAQTRGGEYACPCPKCGGKDRFHLWPEQGEGGTWYCRQCGKGGDCIEFLRYFEGLSFGEACKRLHLSRDFVRRLDKLPQQSAPKAFTPRADDALPPDLWQERASALLDFAERQLAANAEALAWLAARGISAEAARRYRLGWLPGENGRDCYFRSRASWGLAEEKGADGKARRLWIPQGLVIPALDEAGRILRLRLRRPEKARENFGREMKYVVIPGSNMRPLLLRPAARAFVVVEAELDAIALAAAAEAAQMDVGALAVGTNLGKPDAQAHKALTSAQAILVALDFDAPKEDGTRPGAQGWPFWNETYATAQRVPVPFGKDPGEAEAAGCNFALWMKEFLPRVFQLAPRPLGWTPAHHASAPVASAPPSAPPVPAEPLPPAPLPPEPKAGAEAYEVPEFAPVCALCMALDPAHALRMLCLAGLDVRRVENELGRDYVIDGWQNWPDAARQRLITWLRRYGQMVWQGLYGAENPEVQE